MYRHFSQLVELTILLSVRAGNWTGPQSSEHKTIRNINRLQIKKNKNYTAKVFKIQTEIAK